MSVKLVKDTITPSIARIKAGLKDLPKEAYDFWVKQTPVRSGNARRKTRLSQNTIEANYPYAQRLDEGWSEQAPNGMSTPTGQFINRRTKEILRK